MGHEIESFEHAGMKVSIVGDDSPENPREWDNVGRMVCAHRRYSLGDDAKTLGFTFRPDDFGGWDEVEKYLRKEQYAFHVLPLVLHDHGSLSISVGTGQGWDTGRVGFAYITRDAIDEELPHAESDEERLKYADKVLRAEVKTYGDFLSGEVYGYYVTDACGEDVDSCFGIYGEMDYVRSEARASAATFAPKAQARQDKYKAAIKAAREAASHATPDVAATINEGLMLLARREGV